MSTFEPSRRNRIAFYLWVAGGIVWIIANGWFGDHWLEHYAQRAQFVRPIGEPVRFDPPKPGYPRVARDAEGKILEWGQDPDVANASAVRGFLGFCPVLYGVCGALVFRRWGCVSGVVGAGIILLSWFAMWATSARF